jgi:hypothetical protein
LSGKLFLNYHFVLFIIDEISKASKIKATIKANTPHTALLPRSSKSASVTSLWQERGGYVNQVLQKCILSYIGGAIIRRWKKSHVCLQCQTLLCNPAATNQFLIHKQFEHTLVGLQYPSELVVTTLTHLETLFMGNYSTFFSRPSVLSQFLDASVSIAFPQTTCHPQLRHFIFNSYFFIRIRHQCKLLTLSVKDNKYKAQKKAKHIGIIARNLKRRSVRSLNRR